MQIFYVYINYKCSAADGRYIWFLCHIEQHFRHTILHPCAERMNKTELRRGDMKSERGCAKKEKNMHITIHNPQFICRQNIHARLTITNSVLELELKMINVERINEWNENFKMKKKKKRKRNLRIRVKSQVHTFEEHFCSIIILIMNRDSFDHHYLL